MWVIGWKGRKEKGYWRKEGRRRVMGVGRKEKGDWKEEGTNEKFDWRKEGRNERMKQKRKKGTLPCSAGFFAFTGLSYLTP